MIERISPRIAGILGLTTEQEEILSYGLLLIRSTLLSLAAVVLAGVIAGNLLGALLISLVVAILRIFGGGAHCDTEYRCAVTSAVIFGGLGFFAPRLVEWVKPEYVEVLTVQLILISTYIWAPLASPQKPIQSVEHRRKFRFLSYAAILMLTGIMFWTFYLDYVLISTCIAIGFGWQSLLISPAGSKLIGGFDWLLARIDLGIRRLQGTQLNSVGKSRWR